MNMETNTQKINWYRTPLDKDLLKKLTKRSDLRGLLQAGSFLFMYAGFIALAVYLFLRQLWLPMAVVCYFHAIFVDYMGMEAAVHEMSHGTPFKTKWLNEVFYRIFSFLTWNNYLHFRISHMKHHQYTAYRGIDKEVIIEKAPYTFLDYVSWFTFDVKKFKMIMFTNIAHFFGNGNADFFFWDPLLPEGDEQRRKMIRWARIMVIGHIVLLAAFIYFQLWILIFLVTFSYFFATFLSHGTVIIQHHGLCPNRPDWRVICHTVKTGPLMSYLYWRMNFHIEHHMYAAVPFFNLKELSKAVAHDLPVPPKGFFAGLKRIRKIHKRQRTEPEYCFVAEFPGTAAPPRMGTET
jgi:fatty acid desaturase